jgi:hypothetical protein
MMRERRYPGRGRKARVRPPHHPSPLLPAFLPPTGEKREGLVRRRRKRRRKREGCLPFKTDRSPLSLAGGRKDGREGLGE